MADMETYVRNRHEQAMDERHIEQEIALLKERADRLQSIIDYNTMMETIIDPEAEA